MPQGLEIYKPDGSVRATYSDRLARVAGIATTVANVAGSATFDATKGTPWAGLFLKDSLGIFTPATLTVSAGVATVSWPAQPKVGFVIYGVY